MQCSLSAKNKTQLFPKGILYNIDATTVILIVVVYVILVVVHGCEMHQIV